MVEMAMRTSCPPQTLILNFGRNKGSFLTQQRNLIRGMIYLPSSHPDLAGYHLPCFQNIALKIYSFQYIFRIFQTSYQSFIYMKDTSIGIHNKKGNYSA